MRNKGFHIHLHLDHPERENPWLEEPEPDLATAPFLDDADRALHACWGPLSTAERRGPRGELAAFSNLYALTGFDAAPAVLDRIERRAPEAYARLVQGARSGALATAYPALYLPGALSDDRRAAVRWGLRDFKRRFGTEPRGFVPPAGAADDALLELLAREGLRYVLLPAAAAASVQEPDGTWRETAPETLDCTRPYRWRCPAEPALTLAVYFAPPCDPASVLRRPALPLERAPARPAAAPDEPDAAGERLAGKVADTLRVNDSAELAHAAFDAAWFGVRAPRGERALARALDVLERDAPAEPESYESFLDRVGTPQEAALRPGASRACPHGGARWTGSCDCRPEGAEAAPEAPATDWKAPLRAALASLSADLAAEARTARAPLVRDPDAAVDAVGRLAFVRDEDAQQAYLDAVCRRHPRPAEALTLLRLAELERWRLKSLSLWAFEDSDPAGRNALQALRCAARALDLAALCFGKPKADRLEASFVDRLAAAPSRGTPFSNAAAVYRRLAAPERSGAERAAADAAAADHLALEPAPSSPARPAAAWLTSASPLLRRARREGRSWGSLSVIRLSLRHRRTYEAFEGLAAVLQRPSAELEVRLAAGPADPALPGRLEALFLEGNGDGLTAALDRAFGPASWSLDALFPGARRAAARSLADRGGPERRARAEAFVRLGRRRAEPAPREWAEALKSLGEDLPADGLPGASSARKAAARAARRFAESPGEDSLGDLLTFLEAAHGGGLHLPLWELRGPAWRGLAVGPAAGAPARRLAELLGLPPGGKDAHA